MNAYIYPNTQSDKNKHIFIENSQIKSYPDAYE